MALDDGAADGEAESQTVPAFFGSEEWFEQIGQNVGWYADAVVLHLNRGLPRLREVASCDSQRSTVRHGVDRVHHEGEDHLLDLRGIALHQGQIRREIQVQFNARQLQFVLNQLNAALDHVIYVGRLERERRGAQ